MQYMNTFCSLRFKERNNVVVYVFKVYLLFFLCSLILKGRPFYFKNLLISISSQYDVSDVALHFILHDCFKRFHYLH